MKKCKVKNCYTKHLAKGYCNKHYQRLYKHGRLHVVILRGTSSFTRVMQKVKKEGGHWIFTGTLCDKGYGHIRNGKKMKMAHRITFENRNGKIKKGLEIDHKCRVRNCVNPLHLEAVTHQVNCSRGLAGQDHQNRVRNSSGQFEVSQ